MNIIIIILNVIRNMWYELIGLYYFIKFHIYISILLIYYYTIDIIYNYWPWIIIIIIILILLFLKKFYKK